MTALLRLLVVLEPHRAALSRAAGVMLSRQRLAVAFLSLCISAVFKVFIAETPFQVWLMRWTMIMVASIFWTLAAAQFAFLGMQDPEKRSLASPPAPKGNMALVIPVAALAGGAVSLLCSLVNLGAIEMLFVLMCYNSWVFRALWRGAAGPSNALRHGDMEDEPCPVCGAKGCAGGCCV